MLYYGGMNVAVMRFVQQESDNTQCDFTLLIINLVMSVVWFVLHHIARLFCSAYPFGTIVTMRIFANGNSDRFRNVDVVYNEWVDWVHFDEWCQSYENTYEKLRVVKVEPNKNTIKKVNVYITPSIRFFILQNLSFYFERDY